jgi:hypothetical protein
MWQATKKMNLLYRSTFIDLKNKETFINAVRTLTRGDQAILFDNMTGMQTTTTFVAKPPSHSGRPYFNFENGSWFQINRAQGLMNMNLMNQVKAPKETLDRYEVKVEFVAYDGTSFKIPASSTVNYVDDTESTWVELLDEVNKYRIAKPFIVNDVT